MGRRGQAPGKRVGDSGRTCCPESCYGDYHAQWYGDPDKRIIWWPAPGTSSEFMYRRNLMSSHLDRDDFGFGGRRLSCRGSYQVWHLLDNHANVDVDVTDSDYLP